MRKLGKFLLIGLVVVAALAAAVYFYFSANWKRWLREAMESNLRADVHVQAIDIDSWYPVLRISLRHLEVVGREAPFAGDTLLRTPRLTLGFDLYEALFHRRYELRTLELEGGRIFLHAVDSQANWDIVKESSDSEAAESPTDEASDFSMRMHRLVLEGVTFHYLDEDGNMEVAAAPVNIQGDGAFEGDSLAMKLEGTIGALTYRLDDIAYLSRVRVTYAGGISYHLPSATFRFPHQQISLNALPLRADGYVTLADDAMPMRLELQTDHADLKKLLSLIPTVYRHDYADLQARGTATFHLAMDGTYSETQFPHTQISMAIRDGWFTYPDLPHPMEHLQLDVTVQNEGPTLDQWAVDMPRLAFQMQGDPFAASLRLKEEQFAFSADGTLHLESWQSLFRLDSLFPVLRGTLTSQLEGKASLHAIENEQWEEIQWKGTLRGSGIAVRTADDPITWEIPKAELAAAPQYFRVSDTRIRWDRSEVRLHGLIENPLAYVLGKGPLKGTLSAESPYLDLNPFLTESEAAPQENAPDTTFSAPRLPEDVDLTFQMQADRIHYQDWDIDDFRGTVLIREGRLRLDGVRGQWLGGTMTLNGGYRYGPQDTAPATHWQLSGRNFDIPRLGGAFQVTQRLAPILRYMQGTLQLDAAVKTELDPTTLSARLPTLQSEGRLMIPNAMLEGFPLWQKVAQTLQRPDLEKVRLQQIHLAYTITDGTAEVKPILFKINHYPAMFYGTYRLDDQMDFTLEMQVPASEVKTLIGRLVAGVNLDILGDEPITVVARIQGTSQQPSIKPSIKELGNLKERLLQKGQQFLDQKKQQVRQRLEEEKKKAEEELRRKKEEAERKAREELERRRREAEQKARQEAERRKRELEQKAKEEAEKAKEKAKQKAKDAFNKLLKKP